jgi:hypothetical protein
MRFKLGAAVGFAAGYLVGAKASAERRRQVDDAIGRVRENPRLRHMGEVVSRDAKRLGDAVEERVFGAADSVVDSVAGSSGGGQNATKSTKSGSSN